MIFVQFKSFKSHSFINTIYGCITIYVLVDYMTIKYFIVRIMKIYKNENICELLEIRSVMIAVSRTFFSVPLIHDGYVRIFFLIYTNI